MKKFNKVIQVEVAVDAIAESLLGTMNGNNPHIENVVESIIGSSTTHQLSLLYNALNGYSNDINFSVGDIIKPPRLRVAGYWKQEDIDNNNATYQDVLEAEIVEIDIYAVKKLKVQYTTPKKDGSFNEHTDWISHIDCTLVENYLLTDEVMQTLVDKI